MYQTYVNSPFQIGNLSFPHRLIQGPLAGFSAAPFRQLYYQFIPPAYTVSEMISAHDTLSKHQPHSRYLYRAPEEQRLCYQLAGNVPVIMAQAAKRLEDLGADLIDINCGCPKLKIRKKGAGSALLETPEHLSAIVTAVRKSIQIPLTVKIRISGQPQDILLAKTIEQAGADALIIHGRHWTHDYDTPCNYHHIKQIKANICIPVIANGDICDRATLYKAISMTGCDAYMISRAGCGHPWLYQQLLSDKTFTVTDIIRLESFIRHLQGLSNLEGEHQAVLQSKSLVRYYFRHRLNAEQLQQFYTLNRLETIFSFMQSVIEEPGLSNQVD